MLPNCGPVVLRQRIGTSECKAQSRVLAYGLPQSGWNIRAGIASVNPSQTIYFAMRLLHLRRK